MEYILSNFITRKKFKKYFDIPDIKKENYEDIITKKIIEQTVAKIIYDNPNKNIVSIYNVTNDFIEMDELDTKYLAIPDIYELILAKRFLQSKGIIYIDWSYSNIGVDPNGVFKIFDFSKAGLINTSKPDEWIVEPVKSLSYNNAVSNGYNHPLAIDDYCFTKVFIS
jgi:serine/threonine protein kinase